MAGKEGIFVILDVGKSMKEKYQDTEETRLNFGIESIRQLIRSKLLFNVKRDQIGIILMGKDGDENEAENVNIHTELDFPSIELLDRLNTIEAEDEEDKGDIFFTLDFAIDEFVAKYGKKKWEKKIFLITDGESMSSFSEKKIEELAERINENGIKVIRLKSKYDNNFSRNSFKAKFNVYYNIYGVIEAINNNFSNSN